MSRFHAAVVDRIALVIPLVHDRGRDRGPALADPSMSPNAKFVSAALAVSTVRASGRRVATHTAA
jgi:hypothetical protein